MKVIIIISLMPNTTHFINGYIGVGYGGRLIKVNSSKVDVTQAH